jgi:hypothetical protein
MRTFFKPVLFLGAVLVVVACDHSPTEPQPAATQVKSVRHVLCSGWSVRSGDTGPESTCTVWEISGSPAELRSSDIIR